MIENKICPCCGHNIFKRDDKQYHLLYCVKCGLIIEGSFFDLSNHEWETSHEPLSDGLALESKMASIEKRGNWTSKSKKWYLNLKRYYSLLCDRLLELGFVEGEAWDIFNYSFKRWYAKNVPKNNRRKRILIIEDYLESFDFESFDVTASTSRINLTDNLKTLGYYDEVTIIP